jgi:hypothetical protein
MLGDTADRAVSVELDQEYEMPQLEPGGEMLKGWRWHAPDPIEIY